MAEGSARVLFVGLSASGHGGIQGFNRRVTAALAELGGAFTVAMLADDGHRGFTRRMLTALRSADVLLIGHINLLPLALLHRLLRPRGRRILFAHGIEVWGDPTYRSVRRWEPSLLRRTIDRVAIVSRFSQARMATAFGLDDDRFSLFPNAVDLPPQPPPPSGRTILAVARLGAGEREKHLDKLIRALPLVPAARLVVIGDGPLRDELRALAATLRIADRVALPGAVDAGTLARAYADAAVFALPSSKEGFGIVYLEAWARGLPVIGSRHGGAGEVIADGVDGFTVDPTDIQALAARLRELLDDPELAARMGATGRAKVERQYSNAAFVANLRALLAAPSPSEQ
ncbi:glycosyltransferase family 4 protein [Sphingomonas jeddahensis]|uniref:GDP-mannose-dependent alpha-(1-6)-phosphatidylinositol monomannoside mannosyltransferase n=1 Tax=Sphingomonas jeddahensis TaxID=1915074 RepID=A0A1V2EUT8_9SPHN|nr:glycosyltransferase family 4 protein [Sphingomonas jeddahensis]ONF96441.1 GDP-mannose-dependent alpha-(1-6)-phosphatidylinositol monomannoside mannosyltransferase [Sphingomonas jeddahensis]